MTHLIRSLIRETLLLEEVYGAQAIVYHGTKADPIALIDALLKDKFNAGQGAGAMYGRGLYTVYDPKGTKTEKGFYGDHVIKLKVNLYGYIIFDPDVALKVYKRPLTPAEQAEEVGYSEAVVKALGRVGPSRSGTFTSASALSVYKSLQYEVKGLVFTGENDGRVAVVYDPTTAVPMAWKQVGSSFWTPVDRAALLAPLDRPDVSDREGRPVQQSALRRSAVGGFEAGKWDLLKPLKRLERLPEDQRIVKGGLDLADTPITSLPSGLQVGGSLNLTRTPIASLPAGLQVGGSLYLADTHVTALPTGLKVGGSLRLSRTRVTTLPTGLKVGGDFSISNTPITTLPAGLQVGGNLYLSNTSITSLPADLQVGGELDLYGTLITSLPTGLKVGGNLELTGTPITSLPPRLRVDGQLNLVDTPIASLPAGLRVGGNLILTGTPIASLPADLKVGGSLRLSRTRVTSLPADLQVGNDIYGLDRKYWEDVPEHLKGKLK
jgi:hypothetical protein